MAYNYEGQTGFDTVQLKGSSQYINSQTVYVEGTNSDQEITLARGATKPTDGGAGYAIGCLFRHTDGSTGTSIYINEGSASSCDFNAVATSAGTTATSVTAANEASDATCFPLFVTAATGDLGPKTNAGLTFDSSTGTLTVTAIASALTGNVTGNCSGSSGSCTGNSATVTVANEASDTTCFPLFATAASGSLAGKTNSALTFNAATGALAATSFTGALNGSAAGVTANSLSPKALPAVPTDMGDATITVDISNSNGANVTNFVTDGSVTAGSFSGSASGLTAGSVKATALQNAAADLGDADITVDLSNTNAGNVTNLTIDGALTTGSLAVTGASTIAGDITHTGKLVVRTVTDGDMDATNGTVGEIVFNSVDTKFYGCTVTGTPGTWVAFS